MTFKVIRGQGQGQEMTSVPCRDHFLVIVSLVVSVRDLHGKSHFLNEILVIFVKWDFSSFTLTILVLQ